MLSNESLQPATNSTENDRLACGHDDEDSIDGDTVMSSPGESEIDDDDDICDILSNLITEAAALSHHRSPLQSFKDIFAQEESFLLCNGLDDATPSIGRSSMAETSCPRLYMPTSSPSPSLSNSE